MKQFMSITKALSDESRVRILMALGAGELCACQITALLGLSPSTVSKHAGLLAQAGLVEQRKQGRWVYYRRAGEDAGALVRNTYSYLQHCLGLRPEFKADQEKLDQILKQDPSELSRQQIAASLGRGAAGRPTPLSRASRPEPAR
jgi:ArsR family transcriptional regulator, arsenate/arsenite/antimonite-responsive transcriptional repressor